ncbi:hypothetical protein MASR2M48_08690 [Spirochaetota bacterium]|jgi:hypothetical protein
MAVIDDGFAYLYPKAAQAFSKKASTITRLPPMEASTALYAALDEEQAHTIYLTPLLSSEIPTILSRNESTRVAYMGTATLRPRPRLYTAIFSSMDAADLAARYLATHHDNNEKPEGTRTAALFAGSEADRLAKRFTEIYRQAGGLGDLIVRTTSDTYSQTLADELKSFDIVAGYLASSPSETEQWLSQAFDPYAHIVVEYALPDSGGATMAHRAVAWNVEATIASLHEKLTTHLEGEIPGIWKITEYEGKRGVK